MKICFLSSMHPPFDKRVFEKEAISLAEAGFQVVHLAPGNELDVVQKGVRVITYSHKSGIIGRLLQLRNLYRLAASIDADCYHCNEVDSWFIGVLLKLTKRKKVVFDVHEHYPSTFAESRFPSWMRSIIELTVQLTFKILIPFTDHIVLAKQSIAKDFDSGKHKLIVVRNFTPLKYSHVNIPTSSDDQMITVVHLGLFNKNRGWPQLLDAMVQTNCRNLSVHIIGTFNDGTEAEFQAKVDELKLNKRIFTTSWLPFEEAYQELLNANVGLILFQPGIQNHVYAFPHKMFDYMMAGLPIIVPFFAEEIAPIVIETDCGILVDSSDPVDIAQALDYLANNPDERRRFGKNGRHAVLEKYNWDIEVEKLISMYSKLENDVK